MNKKNIAFTKFFAFLLLTAFLTLAACRERGAGSQAGNNERGTEDAKSQTVKVSPESSQSPSPQSPKSKAAPDESDRHIAAGPFVIKEHGVYKMWFKEQVPGGKSHISYATSKDGIKWEKYEGNPVIEPGDGDAWDAARAGPGKVVKINGAYKIWFLGFNKNGIAAIGHATSKDGIRWEKYKGNPVLKASPQGWDSKSVVGLGVIHDEGIYKMWYAGKDGKEQAIGYAESKDGVRWEKHKNNPVMRPRGHDKWDSGDFVGAPYILKKDGAYHMWYVSLHYTDEKGVRETGYAVSKDGIHWDRYEKNPVLRRGKSGDWDSKEAARNSVMLDEGIYKMWYKGSDGIVDAIGHATSKDGINWEKYKNNPVLAP